MQPIISLSTIVSCKINVPPITAKTDSRHKINDAIIGKVYFCPKIWKVYATPQVKIPAKSKEDFALIIAERVGFSNAHINNADKIPTTKNCRQQAFAGLIFSE